MSSGSLECRVLRPEFSSGLARLFENLIHSGAEIFFHPHPLTKEEAWNRANYSGKDLYYVLVDGALVLGYGMLRGWEEGYEIPSLGIAIDPWAHGQGYGKMFMHFLHAAAQRRGATRVRLKVQGQNTHAAALYRSLGYVFQVEEHGESIGYLNLSKRPRT